MFKNLFDLSVKRKGLEIFGFYLVYSILGAVSAGLICGFLIALLHPEVETLDESMQLALTYGPVMAILYGVVIAMAIISAKNIFNSFHAVFLTIISVPLLYFCGASIGMIPIAFLTSFDSKNSTSRN